MLITITAKIRELKDKIIFYLGPPVMRDPRTGMQLRFQPPKGWSGGPGIVFCQGSAAPPPPRLSLKFKTVCIRGERQMMILLKLTRGCRALLFIEVNLFLKK